VIAPDAPALFGVSSASLLRSASAWSSAAAFDWLLPQQAEPMGMQRLIFMFVSVAFGLVFGIWQLFALNSPSVRAWTEPERHTQHHSHSQPHHS